MARFACLDDPAAGCALRPLLLPEAFEFGFSASFRLRASFAAIFHFRRWTLQKASNASSPSHTNFLLARSCSLYLMFSSAECER